MLNEIKFRLQIVLGYQKTDLVSFRVGFFLKTFTLLVLSKPSQQAWMLSCKTIE